MQLSLKDTHAGPFLLAVLACVLTGCATTELTEQERSFEPYEKTRLGGMPYLEFVGRRTAVLLSADDLVVEIADQNSETAKIEMTFKSSPELHLGSATAIDRRGYFVTAAHCVDNGDIQLGFYTPSGNLTVEPARIVWTGESSAVDFDIALLHVDTRLDYVFKWAPDFEMGDTVFGVGVSENTASESEPSEPDFQVRPFAGTVGGSASEEYNDIGYLVVFHDCPMHQGNSGGPLLGKSGQLIAINNARRSGPLTFLHPRSKSTRSVRPDPAWLAGLIESDQAGLSR